MGAISTTAAGVITGYSSQLGSLTSVAKGIMCIPQLLSPSGLAGLTSGILGTLNAVAGEVIAGLLEFVGTVVASTIAHITGVISSQLAAIQMFVADIAQTIALIIGVLTSLDDIAKDTWKFLTDGQNCQFAAAELGKCIVAGLIEEMKPKIAMALQEGSISYSEKINDLTANLLGPEATIAKFTEKSQMFANKAAIQQVF